jgi:hypothetical protein
MTKDERQRYLDRARTYLNYAGAGVPTDTRKADSMQPTAASLLVIADCLANGTGIAIKEDYERLNFEVQHLRERMGMDKEVVVHQCALCEKQFTTAPALTKHQIEKHLKKGKQS